MTDYLSADVPDDLPGTGYGSGQVLFSSRSIGSFVADVTVEEEHSDELAITDHPVETGAAITDHAYRQPARLLIRAGWSNASDRATGDAYVREVYTDLLAFQRSREPFSVVTGKRSYDSMLIQALGVTTDETSEQSLFVTVALREVILVDALIGDVPPASVHADPEDTAPTLNRGAKHATSTNDPVLTADLAALGIG